MLLLLVAKPAIYVNITDIYTESCPIAMDGLSQTNDKIAYSNDDGGSVRNFCSMLIGILLGPQTRYFGNINLAGRIIGLFISWAAIRVLR